MLKGLSGRWRLLAISFATLMAVAVFVVPYRIPVPPTVSQSFQCGFNNHAAVLLFLGVALVASLATGGFRVAQEVGDRPLPRWALVGSLLLTLTLCAVWRLDRVGKPLGSESHYQLNRQVQMVGGLHLYRDLEFIYGPLLIYPGYWLQAGLKWSPVQSYMTQWVLEWLAGTAMLWCIVAWIDLPTRFRLPIFWFLDAFTLWLMLPSDATHYTQMRLFCAAFLSVAVATYWRRTHRAYPTSALMVAAVAGGFAVSPEQGTALALGMSTYALLLAWKERERFHPGAAGLALLGNGLIVALANHAGVLRSMHGFAQGGNNFPLLPSLSNVFVLSTYVCALGAFYRVLGSGEWDNAAVALGLCGIPMLTSAMGRCDLVHIISAMPLLFLGIFWLAGRRPAFAVWLALATYFFFSFSTLMHLSGNVFRKLRPVATVTLPQEPVAGLPIRSGPEYFSPFTLPVGLDGRARWNAQSGRFFGLQNVLTPDDIEAKAAEIRNRHTPFLLLPDLPGEPTPLFWQAERDIHYVQAIEGSPWAPVPRRPLPSTRAVTETIEALYAPTDMRQDGWRVWKLR